VTALQHVADEVADLYARLHVALTPFGGVSNSGRPSGKPGSRPPVNLDASDMIGELDRLAPALTRSVLALTNRPYRSASTVDLLRRLPSQVESLNLKDRAAAGVAEHVTDALHDLRHDASTVLGMGPRRIALPDKVCPYCETDTGRGGTLVADPENGVVWCRNRACGFECGRSECWCKPDESDCGCACHAGGAFAGQCDVEGGCHTQHQPARKHRYRWNRSELLRLATLIDQTEAS
jgi:hypothetical protein